ncbi:hypothetical protein KQI63_08120 [bacterium]|nr:hypothetical protein [bacterium]
MKLFLIYSMLLALALCVLILGCEKESPAEPEIETQFFHYLFMHSEFSASPDQDGWAVVGIDLWIRHQDGDAYDPLATITLDDSITLDYFDDPSTWPKYGWFAEQTFLPGSEHTLHVESPISGVEDIVVTMPQELELIEIDTTDLYPGDFVDLTWTLDPDVEVYRVHVNGEDKGEVTNSDPRVQLKWYPDSTFTVKLTPQRVYYERIRPQDSLLEVATTSHTQVFQVNW